MNEQQALTIFLIEPFFLVVFGVFMFFAWRFLNNFKQKKIEAIEDELDSAGDESVANAKRGELPKHEDNVP